MHLPCFPAAQILEVIIKGFLPDGVFFPHLFAKQWSGPLPGGPTFRSVLEAAFQFYLMSRVFGYYAVGGFAAVLRMVPDGVCPRHSWALGSRVGANGTPFRGGEGGAWVGGLAHIRAGSPPAPFLALGGGGAAGGGLSRKVILWSFTTLTP